MLQGLIKKEFEPTFNTIKALSDHAKIFVRKEDDKDHKKILTLKIK